MKTFLSISAVALLALAGSANAATLDVTLGATSSDISYSASGVALNPNINLGTPGAVSLDSNAHIIGSLPNSVSGQFSQPTGTLFGGNYLAVLGGTGGATFTLANNQATFGFTWGTIDTYNTLVLTTTNGTFTITGTDVLNNANILLSLGNPGFGNAGAQADVSFTDTVGQIKSAELLSTTNSFEAGNFSESAKSAVPLPPALPLFMAAVLGLGFFAWRKRTQKI